MLDSDERGLRQGWGNRHVQQGDGRRQEEVEGGVDARHAGWEPVVPNTTTMIVRPHRHMTL